MTNDVLITDGLVKRVAQAIYSKQWSAETVAANPDDWTDYHLSARAALAVVVPEITQRCASKLDEYRAQFLCGDPGKPDYNLGYQRGTEQACENMARVIRLLGG